MTIAALTTGAVWFSAERVESDIATRAEDVLAQTQSWAGVAISGRDIEITGDAPSEVARSEAIAKASEIDGVGAVTDKTGLLPLESPYRFSVEKSDAGLALSGFAPDRTERDRYMALIGQVLPGFEMKGEVALARGAPDDLAGMIALGTRQLTRMGRGGFTILDDDLAISGEALSPEDYDLLMEDVQAAGETVSAADVALPAAPGPYVFKATRGADELRLSGYATSEAERERLLGLGGAEAVGDLRLADGSPEGVSWSVAAAKAIEAAMLLAEGTAEISGTTLNIAGDARDLDAFRELQELIGAPLPGGLTLGTTDIGLPKPAAQTDGSSR
ncbi:MAG: hypothetical protein CML29_16165 [Rhizobiales bacterium]|nr:hypothetical protein [Hyphomicrobiales bacterium]